MDSNKTKMDKATFLTIFNILNQYGNVRPSKTGKSLNLFATSAECDAKVTPLLPSGWTLTRFPAKELKSIEVVDGADTIVITTKPAMTCIHQEGTPMTAEEAFAGMVLPS